MSGFKHRGKRITRSPLASPGHIFLCRHKIQLEFLQRTEASPTTGHISLVGRGNLEHFIVFGPICSNMWLRSVRRNSLHHTLPIMAVRDYRNVGIEAVAPGRKDAHSRWWRFQLSPAVLAALPWHSSTPAKLKNIGVESDSATAAYRIIES